MKPNPSPPTEDWLLSSERGNKIEPKNTRDVSGEERIA